MVIGRLGPEYHTVDLTGCVPERRGTALLSWEPNMRLARLSVRLGALALVLCGCAAELTPQQEWAMKNFEECKRETNAINAKLTRVTPDGQMYIEASQTQTEANRVIECMKQRANPPR